LKEAIKVFVGIVRPGYGLATSHLASIMGLIEQRIGLVNLESGTLNVTIDQD
jgi:hypothetical protein